MKPDVQNVSLTVDEAHLLGRRALIAAGIGDEEAHVIADHLIDNMLCGYDFAGLPRILAIHEHPNMKLTRTDIEIIHETPNSALIDGGNHVGYWPVLRGAELAACKAAESGMAIVGVNNCWFSGRNAYYLERIARRGLIGIHSASASGNVVPPGAARPRLGTNPIGFALPMRDNPLIFDMGTSATTWGEVLLHASLNKAFPAGVGVDATGLPTTSPHEMMKGGVLTFGGHKGYGLSLIVQALGILAGAKRAAGNVIDSGFLFIAIDPELLMPLEDFYDQLAEMLDEIRGLPRQPGVEKIRIPSERAIAERAERQRLGVSLPRSIHQQLVALSELQCK